MDRTNNGITVMRSHNRKSYKTVLKYIGSVLKRAGIDEYLIDIHFNGEARKNKHRTYDPIAVCIHVNPLHYLLANTDLIRLSQRVGDNWNIGELLLMMRKWPDAKVWADFEWHLCRIPGGYANPFKKGWYLDHELLLVVGPMPKRIGCEANAIAHPEFLEAWLEAIKRTGWRDSNNGYYQWLHNPVEVIPESVVNWFK